MNPLGQLAAVAGVTFKEIWRSGALWVAAAAAAALAFGAPFLDHEGGSEGRLRVILAATMGAAELVGALLAVGLAAITFSRETDTGSICVTVTKPAPRWALFGGKLGGVSLALLVALALVGLGGAAAARAAMYSEAYRAEDPDAVLMNLSFCREQFPEAPGDAKAVVLSRGQSRTCTLSLPESERSRSRLKLRLYARPANPYLRSAPVSLVAGGEPRKVYCRRERPADVVLYAPRGGWGGELAVTVSPAADEGGNVERILVAPRGGAALALGAEPLEAALAKGLAVVWMQFLVVAAVTLAAAGVLSFPVAVVTGAATVLGGHLSGLAVELLRQPGPHAAHEGAEHAAEAAGSGAAEMAREAAAGALSALPDFDRFSASDLLAAGNFVPWSLLGAAALSLLLARMLPAAALGCLFFWRREVGK